MRTVRILILLLAVLMAGLAVAWKLSEPEPLPTESASAALLRSGPWRVAYREFELVDTSRPTDPNADFGGSPERKLRTRLWFPAAEDGKSPARGPFPLVVYSHGFFSNVEEATYLARFLVSHGYLLVAADFPLTSFHAPGGANAFDVINQPGDLSFLLDTLLAWNRASQSPFHQRIDPRRIAAVGTSLGGIATTLVAYHPRVGDPRIKAAISLAGPQQMFGRGFFAHSEIPFMMLAADIDAIVPYAENARPVLQRVNNAWLVTIHGGTHTGFAAQASGMRWLDNADSVACWFIPGKVPESVEDGGFMERLGSAEEGLVHDVRNDFCPQDPLPRAVSPLVQQRIVLLAVYSFLGQNFDPDAAARERYRDYLENVMATELAGVDVERSSPPIGE